MKKIISILLVCVMLISATAVFASPAPSLDFLKQIPLNVEQTGTVSFKLNEPFGLMELIKQTEEPQDLSNHVDLTMLFESLFDSTMTVNSKTQISEDGKKWLAEAHINSNILFKANNNLSGDIKANYSVWSDFDFSDEENPYFQTIMTQPDAAKYITMDSDLMLKNDGEAIEELLNVYKILFDAKNLASINDEAVESIKRNAYVTGNSKNVKIVFTDMGLKMYFADVVTSALNRIDKNALDSVDMDMVKKVLAKVPVFENEAMSIEYTLDSKGRITEEKETLNVNLNIYDLVCAIGGQEYLDYIGITKENSTLNFSVYSNTSLKYKFEKIEKPYLTEENSIDILHYQDPYYDYDFDYDDEEYYDDYDDEYYSPWCYADIDSNCFGNNGLEYVQLRSFFEDMGYEVSYKDGAIIAESQSKYVKHKALCFIANSATAYTDTQTLNLKMPLVVKDSTAYISVSDCEELANMKRDSVYYNFDTKYGYLEFYCNE